MRIMNKKQYIKKVIRLLGCSRQQKRKIQLDLENDIEMALKQGESLEDIIQRMGAPEEVAREFNENMGVQPPRSHKKMIIIIIGLLVGVGLAVFLFIRSMIPEYTDLQDSSYFQQEQVAQIMAEVILDVSPLDEQSLIERCDETMAQTLTEHSLSEALESLGELGDFQRITSERYVEVNQNGYICVIGEIVALYQKRSVTYTITLDQNYQLAGLYMK
ncbi:hypothetical protein B5E75_12255 [Massilimicrobiota timonensis]|uniref:DUF3887 domain-containing protein n=2 Tax=Massilimicrobiota timonensis TaxID=1776392 RepID=A0A1Y4SRG2_9FIRM|nr:hypothetical protein B5E75_12255 [Massilimicrobiota timonensis]